MLNNMMDLLADVPPTTAILWAVWLGAGLLLNMWHRRARAELVYEPAAPRAAGRPKSGVRPPATRPAAAMPAAAAAAPAAPAGDPFGDLEKIFEPQVGTHRTPGESPILSSAGTPVIREPNLESTH